MQLSGKKVSILHLATHGFFYTASSSQRETFFDNLRNLGLLDMNINSTEDISPMQRSGLMLSNGNRVWMNEVEKAGDCDGVLLASEVLNMDLFGTELLVLSACETGLGDMSVEGIMGLQRAFKLAGVNTIVMSLWEVDDAATTFMMEQFYENLMSGKSKRESFSLAQQKVRKQYPEPQYWASFIMLD
jgi:CHAT domain-containing protein